MTTSNREDEYDRCADADGVIQAEFDWSSLAPSIAVIEAVAIAADREPTALDPLHEAVDTDALNALLTPREKHPTDGITTVSFEFAGRTVTVQSNGEVVVRPGESRHESE
ncbi:HalOD1 output domain-containing protein [Halorarius litoreus]|uniref:HalOD1 output domain-containing protein n=1 Tax=Halorarius litoreus TaxID=2962676 RepID=UPI0020CEFCD9|nr:HalOD1 output domain-containing protein [Halorarius litoreus]